MTRPDDVSGLAARLVHRGAWVEQVPLTKIEPLDAAPLAVALAALPGTAWFCATSANAVRVVADHLAASAPATSAWRTTSALAQQLDAAGVRVAAVGDATARALDALGVHVDIVATQQDADGLADALVAHGVTPGARVFFPAAEAARSELPDRLRAVGAVVTVCAVYRSVPDVAAQAALGALIARSAVDLVTVTAPSVVRGVLAALSSAQVGAGCMPVASIGPVTTAAAVAAGLTVACEADPHSSEGLVAAIERWCAQAVRT